MLSTSNHSNKASYFNEYVECPDYKSLQAIIRSFPHLKSLQQERNFEQNRCRGVVIRSGNDDNIHKAIKYGIWTTTYRNKHKLDQYWKDCVERKIDTYMFFSAVKSGHVEGVARLASGYLQQTFPFWWENQNGKFKGHFEIEWIYVKDIGYRHFQGLKNELDEDFVKSKDCDDISQDTTKKVLDIYRNYKKSKSIFSSFDFFDKREKEQLRSTYTQEQMWMMGNQFSQFQMQQYQQYQQQMMMASMQQPNYFYGVQEVQIPIKEPTNGFVKPATTSNPGFTMNPVSKPKRKDKDSK